mmetsp:Transcript_3589/g.9975  ORF Transcript_3589/g.9975 Transcript_3589/m.9975 type:complete len:248 (+) Transcript_3589:1198-1941(+)
MHFLNVEKKIYSMQNCVTRSCCERLRQNKFERALVRLDVGDLSVLQHPIVVILVWPPIELLNFAVDIGLTCAVAIVGTSFVAYSSAISASSNTSTWFLVCFIASKSLALFSASFSLQPAIPVLHVVRHAPVQPQGDRLPLVAELVMSAEQNGIFFGCPRLDVSVWVEHIRVTCSELVGFALSCKMFRSYHRPPLRSVALHEPKKELVFVRAPANMRLLQRTLALDVSELGCFVVAINLFVVFGVRAS